MSDGCPGEAPVTPTTRPLGLLEADEAGTDPRQGCRRLPACRGQLPEGMLQPGQLVGGGRPGRLMHERRAVDLLSRLVGVVGFEPTTSAV